VFARLHRIALPLGTAAMEKRLWSEAEALVSGERPGDLNQALMELGATICTPRAPRCGECPVRFACEAHRHGEVGALPIAKKRKAPSAKRLIAVVATSADRTDPGVLLFKGDRALFGGLFGLPTIERRGDDQRDARAALAERGLRTRRKVAFHGSFVHVLSHLTLEVEVASITGIASSEHLHPRSALHAIGVSRFTQRALEQAGFLEPRPTRSAPRARG
jgi:A/G-specific adenine glycosylase